MKESMFRERHVGSNTNTVVDIVDRKGKYPNRNIKQTRMQRFCQTFLRGLCILFIIFILIRIIWYMLMQGYFDQDVKDKIMVIYSMQDTPFTLAQGMFADWVAVVGALKYAVDHGAAGVRVVYQNDWYVDPERGDYWWDYFFEPLMIINPDIMNPEETHFNRWFARYGKIGSFSQNVKDKDPSLILDDDPYKDFPYPIQGRMTLEQSRQIVKDYFRVKPEFQAKVDAIRSEHIDDDTYMIGIHYRGTDKVQAFPYIRPPMHYFKFYVEQVLEKYKPQKYKIFIATDSSDFIDYAKSNWSDDELFFIENSPRLSDDDAKAATRGQGGLHKSNKFSPYAKAESGVIDFLLLASCKYLIKNRSSLSDAALAVNEDLQFTYFLTPDFPVYSSDNMPQPPPTLVPY